MDLLNQLLSLTSEIPNLFIIGCTNMRSAIDSAFLRCGRLESQYFLGMLGEMDRSLLLRRIMHELDVPEFAKQVTSSRTPMPSCNWVR